MSFFRLPLRLPPPLLRLYPLRHASTTSTRPKFWHARIALATSTFALFSFSAGALSIKQLLPGTGPIDTSDLHLPGSPADTAEILASMVLIKASPLYKMLAVDPGWVEQEDVYTHLSPGARKTKLISGTLWGHRKISCNKVFFSKDGRESTSLLTIGTALCGHPNVVHGGVLATVLDEALGRLAIRQFPDGGAVTARLEVNYRAPARAKDRIWNRDGWVVLGAKVVAVEERKVRVKGEIRDKEGKLLVESEALFVVPKGWKPKPLGDH